jgi:hypothetical protein
VAFSESESHTNSLSKSELWRKMATIHTIQVEQSYSSRAKFHQNLFALAFAAIFVILA